MDSDLPLSSSERVEEFLCAWADIARLDSRLDYSQIRGPLTFPNHEIKPRGRFMNLRCFFSHDWHNVSSIVIEANGEISGLRECYSTLGERRHSDRICKRCDKIEFNKEIALEKNAEMMQEKRDAKKKKDAEGKSLEDRFYSFKKMRDKARG